MNIKCNILFCVECPWKENKLTSLPTRYPLTIEDKVKYEVFKDLWEKNFYITCGTKFGGDFLVYAGKFNHFKFTPRFSLLVKCFCILTTVTTFCSYMKFKVKQVI